MEQDLASATIAKQIIRSGTSVSANYRAACTAEESDETAHWIELLIESELFPSQKLLPLNQESEELTRIFLSSIKTARDNS